MNPFIVSVESDKEVVCYFINWARWRPGDGQYVPDDLDPELCTVINYAFAIYNETTGLIDPHDDWTDIDPAGGGGYSLMVNILYSIQFRHIPILISTI